MQRSNGTTWVKICGIHDVRAAAAIARLEPDAIGLNFFTRSPRTVSVEAATEIVRALPPAVVPIGLFVNHSVDEIQTICRATGITMLQLHGDESPEHFARMREALSDARLIRAHRLGPEGLEPLDTYLKRCRELGVELTACLIDSRVEGTYGGSGETVCWETLAQGWHSDWPPLILAGGLKPDNVASAIQTVRPWGVDVASGVESSRGVPNLELVGMFIQNAREALCRTANQPR